MTSRLAFLILLVAGCSDPPFALRFRITHGAASACVNSANQQVTSCADVSMLCRAVVSIRILNPDDPTAPYISVCKELTGQPNLCSIAGVDLPKPAQAFPEQRLEIQMVVFPYSAVTVDPTTGDLQCPTDVQFDATGFPVTAVVPCDQDQSCPIVPAVGGVAYYHPGDAETVVDLGCTDLKQLDDPSCAGKNQIAVTATVDDFDTEVSVQPSLADRLAVSIGEPVGLTINGQTHYVLYPNPANALPRTAIQPIPGWSADVDGPFGTACLEVVEDSAQSTTSLVCKPVGASATRIDMTGVRIAKSTLLDVLGAIGQPQFPDNGLVIGIVLDYLGNPAANVVVSPTAGTVTYLSSDRHNIITGGTSTSGIFVSQDAPFGTTFSANSALQTIAGFGGLVDSKVTVVVLQFQMPTGN